VLRQAVEVEGATFGNIQVYNPEASGLEIIAHQGFNPKFLELFKLVLPDDSSVCARAYRLANRIAIPDLRNDPQSAFFFRQAQEIGFRALQSTPILDTHGCVIGMLSTHFAKPHYLSRAAELALDQCAERASELLQQFLARKSV
jgi:GAF domain-containing protein